MKSASSLCLKQKQLDYQPHTPSSLAELTSLSAEGLRELQRQGWTEQWKTARSSADSQMPSARLVLFRGLCGILHPQPAAIQRFLQRAALSELQGISCGLIICSLAKGLKILFLEVSAIRAQIMSERGLISTF